MGGSPSLHRSSLSLLGDQRVFLKESKRKGSFRSPLKMFQGSGEDGCQLRVYGRQSCAQAERESGGTAYRAQSSERQARRKRSTGGVQLRGRTPGGDAAHQMPLIAGRCRNNVVLTGGCSNQLEISTQIRLSQLSHGIERRRLNWIQGNTCIDAKIPILHCVNSWLQMCYNHNPDVSSISTMWLRNQRYVYYLKLELKNDSDGM